MRLAAAIFYLVGALALINHVVIATFREGLKKEIHHRIDHVLDHANSSHHRAKLREALLEVHDHLSSVYEALNADDSAEDKVREPQHIAHINKLVEHACKCHPEKKFWYKNTTEGAIHNLVEYEEFTLRRIYPSFKGLYYRLKENYFDMYGRKTCDNMYYELEHGTGRNEFEWNITTIDAVPGERDIVVPHDGLDAVIHIKLDCEDKLGLNLAP